MPGLALVVALRVPLLDPRSVGRCVRAHVGLSHLQVGHGVSSRFGITTEVMAEVAAEVSAEVSVLSVFDVPAAPAAETSLERRSRASPYRAISSQTTRPPVRPRQLLRISPPSP